METIKIGLSEYIVKQTKTKLHFYEHNSVVVDADMIISYQPEMFIKLENGVFDELPEGIEAVQIGHEIYLTFTQKTHIKLDVGEVKELFYYLNNRFQKVSDVMIDIETLGVKLTSVMVSISAIPFNIKTGYVSKRSSCFEMKLDPQDGIDKGYTVDWNTIKFWLNADKDAKKELISERGRLHVKHFLDDFESWFGNLNGANIKVWGNGSSFDLGIIRNYYERNNKQVPWSWYNEQDLRTALRLGERFETIPFEGVKHDPYFDSLHQIKKLFKSLK